MPSFTTSIVARIGMPIAASVRPSDSIIARWPSAVPPLCEPIAGKRNGRAPRSRSQSPAAFVMAAILAMPRLPAVMPTSPCGTDKVQPIERSVDRSRDVDDRIRDQLLADADEFHGGGRLGRIERSIIAFSCPILRNCRDWRAGTVVALNNSRAGANF